MVRRGPAALGTSLPLVRQEAPAHGRREGVKGWRDPFLMLQPPDDVVEHLFLVSQGPWAPALGTPVGQRARVEARWGRAASSPQEPGARSESDEKGMLIL
jgi:hypothetical protein